MKTKVLAKVIDELDKNMSTLKAYEQRSGLVTEGSQPSLRMTDKQLSQSPLSSTQSSLHLAQPQQQQKPTVRNSITLPSPQQYIDSRNTSSSSSESTSNEQQGNSATTTLVNPSTQESNQMPPPSKVRLALGIFEEVLRLEMEVFQLPVDLATLFPGYYQQLPANYQQLLWGRVQALKVRVEQMGMLRDSVLSVVRGENIALILEKTILEGKGPVGNLQAWIKENYPASNPASQQPRTLIINIMRWLNSLLKLWEQVLDEDCD